MARTSGSPASDSGAAERGPRQSDCGAGKDRPRESDNGAAERQAREGDNGAGKRPPQRVFSTATSVPLIHKWVLSTSRSACSVSSVIWHNSRDSREGELPHSEVSVKALLIAFVVRVLTERRISIDRGQKFP
jgi:hypothetical protein